MIAEEGQQPRIEEDGNGVTPIEARVTTFYDHEYARLLHELDVHRMAASQELELGSDAEREARLQMHLVLNAMNSFCNGALDDPAFAVDEFDAEIEQAVQHYDNAVAGGVCRV
jgi:hypothetical protein